MIFYITAMLFAAKLAKYQVKIELSDALFYLVRAGLDVGVTLEELMMMQLEKLVKQSNKYNRTFLK
jgi:hypothetical protein